MACPLTAAVAAADLEVGRALEPLAGFGMAGEELSTQLENVCSEAGSTWADPSGPVLAPCGAGGGSILDRGPEPPKADAGFELPGGALELGAGEGGVEVAGRAAPRLALWRGESGPGALGFDPSARAQFGMAGLSLEAIQAESAADVPLSVHRGSASAHLLLLRSGWAAGQPFWFTFGPERLELRAEASAVPLPGETLEGYGRAALTLTPNTETSEYEGMVGLGTGSAWQSRLKPEGDLSLRALEAPGSELLAQLRATSALTYDLRAGGEFHVMIEYFDDAFLRREIEDRGLMLRLRWQPG
jgi:hypothetical protein